MLNKFVFVALIFLFGSSSIPDSLGCVKCWGKPGQSFSLLDLANNQEMSKSPRGSIKIDQPVLADPNGSLPCHFCMMETADNPGSYELPGLVMFSGIRPIPMAQSVAPVYSFNRPPEFLL
jgi:hypothetical protein